MKIAMPIHDSKLSAHFGHCQQFYIFDVNTQTKQIEKTEHLTPPAHEPGVLPAWLKTLDVGLIIAGGMGNRAQNLFTENGIKVLVGAESDEPENLINQYLLGTLSFGTNICDH